MGAPPIQCHEFPLDTMTKQFLLLALGMLCLGTVATAQPRNAHCITDTPGSTSTSNWMMILRTDDIGVIYEWHRYKGADPRREGVCIRTLLETDPGGKPDTVMTGVSKIGPWTIKLNLSSTQEITRIWGQDATGQFWMGALALRKIATDEPRRGRRAPQKNIH